MFGYTRCSINCTQVPNRTWQEHSTLSRNHLPLADSFFVLMILAAYSWPDDIFTHRLTTEKAPLKKREKEKTVREKKWARGPDAEQIEHMAWRAESVPWWRHRLSASKVTQLRFSMVVCPCVFDERVWVFWNCLTYSLTAYTHQICMCSLEMGGGLITHHLKCPLWCGCS